MRGTSLPWTTMLLLLTLPTAAATGGPGASADVGDAGVAMLEVWSDSRYRYRISAVMAVEDWSYRVTWDECDASGCTGATDGPHALHIFLIVHPSPPLLESDHLFVTGSHAHTEGGLVRSNYCVEVLNGSGATVVVHCA